MTVEGGIHLINTCLELLKVDGLNFDEEEPDAESWAWWARMRNLRVLRVLGAGVSEAGAVWLQQCWPALERLEMACEQMGEGLVPPRPSASQ